MARCAVYESHSMQPNSTPRYNSTIVAAVSEATLCGSIMVTSAAHAAQRDLGTLSEGLLQGRSHAAKLALLGSAVVVGCSIATVATAGHFVVKSVSTVGEGFVMVLSAVVEAVDAVVERSAELSVKVALAALRGASVVVGTALCVVRETAG